MTATILVIEDDSDSLELIAYLLRAFGHQVTTASTGTDGYKLAIEEKFDLIISDIQLPGMDGLELVSRLKARPQTRYTPIITVTALAMVGDREKLLAAGFDGYISKPLAPETLRVQINKYIKRR